jgi:Domain of unknown function (DUF1824)
MASNVTKHSSPRILLDGTTFPLKIMPRRPSSAVVLLHLLLVAAATCVRAFVVVDPASSPPVSSSRSLLQGAASQPLSPPTREHHHNDEDSSSSSGTSPSTRSDSSRAVESVEEASRILAEWDRYYNQESATAVSDASSLLPVLPDAVRLLNEAARAERDADSTKGRCMLGICADDAKQGVAALKSWVTSLQLPRGLLHGMDKDGAPIEIESAVYIKYNTGGVLTFADIRKTGMGFDALWRPGDALLEPYDGRFRGVYFQVELKDNEFRQYLVPLDLFGPV